MQLSASPASFGKALAIKYNSARLGKHCTLICTGCGLHCAPGAMLRGTQGRNGESKVENNVYRVIDLYLYRYLYIYIPVPVRVPFHHQFL
jgi:hypothetical protein